MSVTITRVESDADFERFLDVLLEYERSLEPDLRHGTEPTLASIRAAYADPNAALLARIDGDAAASVVLTRHDASTAVLQRLYVKPSFRNRGLARTMVQAVVDFAREHGYRRVVLDTDPSRLAGAYKLYVSFGFTPCEPYDAVDYRNAAFLEFVL